MKHRPWEDARDFAIGLRPIPEANWLEGGEADPAIRKDPLFAHARDLVWAETPGSRPAQSEALRLVDHALGSAQPRPDLPPLYAAAQRVPDDLCLMEKQGEWRLTALSLSAGTFFTASEVVGRSLAELHTPVTGFAERLLSRVQRIFDGLRTDLVLERRNWTIVNSSELHVPDPAPIRTRIPTIAAQDVGAALHLRVERQTVRRLPETGAVLFTIRVWLDPLAALTESPQRLDAFARAWREVSSDFRTYKRLELYDPLIKQFLDGASAASAR